MKPATLLVVAGLLAASRAHAADGPPVAPLAAPAPALDLEVDTTWSGEVRLERRVRVRAGVVLRIVRGTRVVVPWAAQKATGDARPGLEVFGGLEADGDVDAPIRFEAERAPPGERERSGPVWLGIVVHPGSTLPARLVRCLVADADAGFQPGRSDATVRDGAFHGCATGVGVGALWEGQDRLIRFTPDVAPRIERCRFGRCFTGITVERTARPHVERCVFHACRTGVGNVRMGVTYPLEGLGPYVDRGEFLRCGVAVQGASRVTHSLFEGNDLVFLGSRFGEAHLTVIDRFVRGRNLYAGNRQLVASDVPLGDDAIFAAPGRRGAVPATLGPEALLGPLDAVLGLAPGSPALGVAAGGGDLGAFGADGADGGLRGAPGLASRPPGLRVERWLVLGPPSPGLLDALPVLAADAVRRPRIAGDAEGDAVWAALEADDLEDDDRARRLAATLPGTRVMLATFTAAAAGRASLRIGYDGTVEAWWNGDPVATPPRARRFRADDVVLRVNVRKGANALLLRHAPRATTGRCLVRLRAEDGRGEAVGVIAAPTARPDAAPPRAAVTGATLTREKGRDGKPTGRARVAARAGGTRALARGRRTQALSAARREGRDARPRRRAAPVRAGREGAVLHVAHGAADRRVHARRRGPAARDGRGLRAGTDDAHVPGP